ncbi:MAG: DUF805 domain-containing protein [Zoogloeaceae bacterium]|jgi:uncharacterized membrane protein YhaH (DUF805 family)|nr:DUF805 domain-containing protein [Zoogloeaceae bacterium]
MPSAFKIRFDGTLTPGANLDEAKGNLARLFRQDAARIGRLFEGGTFTLKRGLSEETARKYVEILRQAGVVARMEAEASAPSEGARKASPKPPPRLELALAPKDPPPQPSPRPELALLPQELPSSQPAPPSSPRAHLGHDKSPLAVLDHLPKDEEYCELNWFSPLMRIGRLRLMARSAVLIGIMLAVVYVGSGIITHTLSPFLGFLSVFILMGLAIIRHHVRPDATLLDTVLLLGIPALLLLLAFGLSFKAWTWDNTENNAAQALPYVGIFISILIVSTQILLMTQQIRRLHDLNRSGGWCLLSLIPYLGLLFFLHLILKGGDETFNPYGSPPPPNTLSVNLGGFLFVILLVLSVSVLPRAMSLRLPTRFPPDSTTISAPEAPAVPPGAPRIEVAPRKDAPPVFQPDTTSAFNFLSSGAQKSDFGINDFTKYSNKKHNLSRAFQQTRNALRVAENDARALERWQASEDGLIRALQRQVMQTRESIETRRRERATPVSSTLNLPQFAGIFDRGVRRTQDIMERLESLYTELLGQARNNAADKTAFQESLERFKSGLNVLKKLF